MPKAGKPTGGDRWKQNGKRNEDNQAADEDYEQVFQLAVKLEEQGERYQFGAKAKRNYEQAIQSYRHSIDLLNRKPLNRSPSDGFNSHFNLARVLVHFGTTFASAPSECLDFVRQGIHEYQLAIDCATQDSNQSDEIDARYNLGLAMSTMAEMLSGGATPTEGLNGVLSHPSPAIQIWKQAKEELSRAYLLQERLLANSPNLGPSATPIDQVDETTSHSIGDMVPQQSQPASPMNGETALVEELFVITPSVLIDTLFDICEVLLSIYPSEPESALTELRHYVQQLQAINQLIEASVDSTFSRRFEIDSLICSIELTTVEHALSGTLMNAESGSSVMAEMSQKLSTVNQKLDELSQDSAALEQDFLKLLGLANNFSSLSTATCSLIAIRSKAANTPITDSRLEAVKLLIEKTMALYSTILGKLKDSKLRPIKQVRPHEVSSYISSSLVGQSELALMMELLDRQRGGQAPSQTTSFDLAIEAYNQSLAPYVIRRDPAPNSFKLAFSSSSAACSTPHEKEARNEWANFSARLESSKWLLRCKFHHVTYPSQRHPGFDLDQIIKLELAPLIAKLSLSRADLGRFYEDLQDDPVYLLSDSIEQSLFELLLSAP